MHLFWKYMIGGSSSMLCVGFFVKHTLWTLYEAKIQFVSQALRL